MQVKEVMTQIVSYAGPDATIPELARQMRDDDIGAVPIAEDDELIGIVTDRDIVVRGLPEGTDVREITAMDVMSPAVLFCSEDQPIEEVLDMMGENQVRRLPVVNKEQRLVGFVSLGDLSQAARTQSGSALQEISQPLRH